MANTINISGSEKTFLELINEYDILVPIIQRDYAQGRTDEKVSEIRKSFIKDLRNYISDVNKRSHSIDFVYGTIVEGDNRNTFVPLDGQQRLTTLFLLHLFLAGVTNNFDNYCKLFWHNNICGFQYKTRKSSTDFCCNIVSRENLFAEYIAGKDHLSTILKRKHEIQDKIDNSDDLKKEYDTIEREISYYNVHPITISSVIKNQWWWFNSWITDPTVQGMLVTLDEIATQISIQEAEQLYDILFNENNRPIVFQWQPLNDYPKTDDLYLKMNARGVPLTLFEIFKAKYEANIPPKYKQSFEQKIDGEWLQTLWKYKDADNDNICRSNVDFLMENILRITIACSFSSYYKNNESQYDKFQKDKINTSLELLLKSGCTCMPFLYSKYSELGILLDKENAIDRNCNESCFNFIAENINSVFDIIRSTLEGTTQTIENNWYDEKLSLFRVLFNNANYQKDAPLKTITYSDLFRFYAYVMAKKRNLSKENLFQWMRFIRNIDESRDINKAVEMATALSFIDSSLDEIQNINFNVLEWLSKKTVYSYSINQFYEESLKAQIILWQEQNEKADDWKKVIYTAEGDQYLRGQICFILAFAGVTDSSKLNLDTSHSMFEDANRYTEVTRSLFQKIIEDKTLIEECILERALLSIGKYLKIASSNRLSMYDNIFDRDYSWRRLLEIDNKTKQLDHSQEIFKELLDKLHPNTIIEDLKSIISSAIVTPKGDWTDLIINNIELINQSGQGFFEELNGMILLLGESQLNHYHSELYSHDLYLQKYKSNNKVGYFWVKSVGGIPGIMIRLKINEEIFALTYTFNYVENSWKRNLVHWMQGQTTNPQKEIENVLNLKAGDLLQTTITKLDVENELNSLCQYNGTDFEIINS